MEGSPADWLGISNKEIAAKPLSVRRDPKYLSGILAKLNFSARPNPAGYLGCADRSHSERF